MVNPNVIRSNNAKKGRYINSKLYHEIKSRKKCKLCGKTKKQNGGRLEVHHKLPISMGGLNIHTNLIAVYKECHIKEHKNKIEQL